MSRYKHSVKNVSEYKSLGQKGKLTIRIDEGQFKGAFASLVCSKDQNKLVLTPKPQVGFLKKENAEYNYFLLDEIPEKEFLDHQGYDLISPQGIVFFGDPNLIMKKLGEKKIPFKMGGNLPLEDNSETMLTKVEWPIYDKILRAISKIAFNYLARWEDVSLVLAPEFHIIREYIRYGHKPSYPLALPVNEPILEDEPIEGQRRLGHIITINRAIDGISIISRVSLFNDMTYCICLARDCPDIATKIMRRGHFFNMGDMTILELGVRTHQ